MNRLSHLDENKSIKIKKVFRSEEDPLKVLRKKQRRVRKRMVSKNRQNKESLQYTENNPIERCMFCGSKDVRECLKTCSDCKNSKYKCVCACLSEKPIITTCDICGVRTEIYINSKTKCLQCNYDKQHCLCHAKCNDDD